MSYILGVDSDQRIKSRPVEENGFTCSLLTIVQGICLWSENLEIKKCTKLQSINLKAQTNIHIYQNKSRYHPLLMKNFTETWQLSLEISNHKYK